MSSQYTCLQSEITPFPETHQPRMSWSSKTMDLLASGGRSTQDPLYMPREDKERVFWRKKLEFSTPYLGRLKTVVSSTRSSLKHKSRGRSSRYQKLNFFRDSFTRVVRGRNMVLFFYFLVTLISPNSHPNAWAASCACRRTP